MCPKGKRVHLSLRVQKELAEIYRLALEQPNTTKTSARKYLKQVYTVYIQWVHRSL